MQVIIDFFEYTLSGALGIIYTILMLIFSLACLGVVGEKVSKKKHEELIARREALAKEESDKAKELVKKQAESYGIGSNLDPTAKKEEAVISSNETNSGVQQNVSEMSVAVPEVVQEANSVQEVVILDAPVEQNENQVVDNITPIVDNTSEDAIKAEEAVPAVLVINDDGTSNVSA